MRHGALLALGVIIILFTFLSMEPVGAHPFDPSAARYHAAVANPIAGAPSDLGLVLRFESPNAMPEPFGGITHRTPPGWHISPDEMVPNGDIVGGLVIALDAMPVTDPSCPPIMAALPSLFLPVPLRDASSDSEAPDYPPFLPPGDHRARWAGVLTLPDMPVLVPVNLIVDEEPSILDIWPPPPPVYALRLFVGPVPDWIWGLAGGWNVLPPCLALSMVLGVQGYSSSGVPVAVNPPAKGIYTFTTAVVSIPDPVDGHRHKMTLEARVSIEKPRPPADYHVEVSDPRPAVNSDLGMALRFGPGALRPEPFGGIVHHIPAGWDIAAGDLVPPGDNTAFLRVVLDVPPSLETVCPLAFLPPVVLVVPLYNAYGDAEPDYFSDLPDRPYKARWVGLIHPDGRRPIPVNVLVRGDSADGHALRIFVGTTPHDYRLPRIPPCFAVTVGLAVRGESASGAPVATNPPLEGVYTFVAEVTTVPDSKDGERITYSVSADVVIKAGAEPLTCPDCPAGDLDSDGLADSVDQCAAYAEDLNEVEDSDGCPDSGDPDSDGLLSGAEVLLGVDAFAPDSEADGLDDLVEVHTYRSDPLDPDTDADGCGDGKEVGPDEGLGGQRDPTNFWDFFDPDFSGAVAVSDIVAVVSRFGSTGDPTGDPLSEPPPPPAYHPRFDRTLVGPLPWDLGPGSGAIAISDIVAAVSQFGHSCEAAP